MNPNYQDEYIRVNPRSKAKCNPILYRDNYKPYFKSDLSYQVSNNNFCNLETFANMPPAKTDIQIVNNNNIPKVLPSENNTVETIEKNTVDQDNYSYVQDISCNGKQATVTVNNKKKMYDISPQSLMKREIIGDIIEIDKIHNDKIRREMSYGDMKLNHLKNTMKKLHYNLNPSMLHAMERNYMGEPFFQDQ
jgi:hypothetical protein